MQMQMCTNTNTNKHAVHNGDAHVHTHAQVVTKEEQVEVIYKYFFDNKKTLTPGTRERTSFQFLPLVGVIIIMGSRMWVVITFQKVIGSISGTACGLSPCTHYTLNTEHLQTYFFSTASVSSS